MAPGIVPDMDQSIAPQHSCEGMSSFAPASSCVDVVGFSWGGFVVAIAIVLGLAGIGWLLWRRVRNRGE